MRSTCCGESIILVNGEQVCAKCGKEHELVLKSGIFLHAQRCKTCNNYTKKGSCLYMTELFKGTHICWDNGEGYFVPQGYREFIESVGCASHSSNEGLKQLQSDIDTILSKDSHLAYELEAELKSMEAERNWLKV